MTSALECLGDYRPPPVSQKQGRVQALVPAIQEGAAAEVRPPGAAARDVPVCSSQGPQGSGRQARGRVVDARHPWGYRAHARRDTRASRGARGGASRL